ncbi:hypothetical protein [Streptomyces barringtoniae]|uniref:hypothetical protein n=1 Tax=Streptomyces barringtoniae TaxID=2892029 RepID=UPI001E5E736C|nr:hypothetical protein [Streptomyces barringtoniae]MCC5480560.1 hypothetical protein [Streptomyces barringtoniae]
MAAAAVIWQQLWEPFSDVLEAEEPEPERVEERLAAVPAACEEAAAVAGIDSRFAALLSTVPAAVTEAGDDQAAMWRLGTFGEVVFAIGQGPEIWV